MPSFLERAFKKMSSFGGRNCAAYLTTTEFIFLLDNCYIKFDEFDNHRDQMAYLRDSVKQGKIFSRHFYFELTEEGKKHAQLPLPHWEKAYKSEK